MISGDARVTNSTPKATYTLCGNPTEDSPCTATWSQELNAQCANHLKRPRQTMSGQLASIETPRKGLQRPVKVDKLNSELTSMTSHRVLLLDSHKSRGHCEASCRAGAASKQQSPAGIPQRRFHFRRREEGGRLDVRLDGLRGLCGRHGDGEVRLEVVVDGCGSIGAQVFSG